MYQAVGTPSCPHLGFDLAGGRPCCHADDQTRMQCGKFATNPSGPAAPGARKSGGGAALGVEAYFCTVLGTDSIPAEALKLAAREKAEAAKQSREASQGPRYRAPNEATGQLEARPSREHEPGEFEDPIIPTHTLHAEKKVMPNDPCTCGSGRKYKKCCGRMG